MHCSSRVSLAAEEMPITQSHVIPCQHCTDSCCFWVPHTFLRHQELQLPHWPQQSTVPLAPACWSRRSMCWWQPFHHAAAYAGAPGPAVQSPPDVSVQMHYLERHRALSARARAAEGCSPMVLGHCGDGCPAMGMDRAIWCSGTRLCGRCRGPPHGNSAVNPVQHRVVLPQPLGQLHP